LFHARWICLTVKSTDLTPSGLGRTVSCDAAPHVIIFVWLPLFFVDWVWAWARTPRPCYLHPVFLLRLNSLHPPVYDFK
jgi:hypothetical protein